MEVHGGLTGRLPRRAEFKNAARKCFQLIDKDQGGTLSHSEIVEAVKSDKVANAASYNAANFNLRGLRDLRNCCFRVWSKEQPNDRFTLPHRRK